MKKFAKLLEDVEFNKVAIVKKGESYFIYGEDNEAYYITVDGKEEEFGVDGLDDIYFGLSKEDEDKLYYVVKK